MPEQLQIAVPVTATGHRAADRGSPRPRRADRSVGAVHPVVAAENAGRSAPTGHRSSPWDSSVAPCHVSSLPGKIWLSAAEWRLLTHPLKPTAPGLGASGTVPGALPLTEARSPLGMGTAEGLRFIGQGGAEVCCWHGQARSSLNARRCLVRGIAWSARKSELSRKSVRIMWDCVSGHPQVGSAAVNVVSVNRWSRECKSVK